MGLSASGSRLFKKFGVQSVIPGPVLSHMHPSILACPGTYYHSYISYTPLEEPCRSRYTTYISHIPSLVRSPGLGANNCRKFW